jgi:hypothetical protein
LSTTLWYSP